MDFHCRKSGVEKMKSEEVFEVHVKLLCAVQRRESGTVRADAVT